ncbi:MAG: uracil-DNA glycosylase [Gammaproteobacteria bacterium]|nr:uracil-DNA glycosylase [Gammaproteobacteria bacterium]
MADAARRARYLEALGINVWVPRHPPVETVVAPVDPATLDWPALRACVSDCMRCASHQGRTQTVFGVGDTAARWMVVGEAPGADEDRQGEPFVGAAGQLLNAMLAAIELPRETVYITNILKCRPPDNRDPRPEEVSACLPYLHRQVALLRPQIILAFGRVAAQSLLGTDSTLGKLRRSVHHFGALNTPVVVTYHPAYLLRSPGEKRKAWEDLKFARRVFAELPPAV